MAKSKKKKRNKKYIPPEKKKCFCGSNQRHEDCCKPYSSAISLLKRANPKFNDIHTTIILEINSILKNLCIESKFLDKLYVSLTDMFLLSDEALNSITDHVHNLKTDSGSRKNDNTYGVDDYDEKFGYYIRHLYISGGVVKDALCKLSNEIGFNLSFLFGNEDAKKFSKKLENLTEKFEDEKAAQKLKEFIFEQKENWLTGFIDNRNLVEHGEFKIPNISYLANKNDKLIPQIPKIENMAYEEFLNLYPINFFHFARGVIIFLLSELSYREEFMDGLYRGVLVPVKNEKLPFGDLNKEKIIYKHTLLNTKTQSVETTNFSRSCPKNRSNE